MDIPKSSFIPLIQTPDLKGGAMDIPEKLRKIIFLSQSATVVNRFWNHYIFWHMEVMQQASQ
jgi:hypothetical protein